MKRTFNKEFIKIAEPIDLAIIVESLQYNLMKQKNKLFFIKDTNNISPEKLIKSIESMDLPVLGEWDELSVEEKDRWNNNKELFDEATISLRGIEFEKMVDKLSVYLQSSDLKSMILGVSGGLDSTLAAIVCYEVEKRTGIKLFCISMPLKNTTEEKEGSEFTGQAWTTNEDNFFIFPIEGIYDQFQLDIQMFGEGWNSRKEKRVGEDAEDTNLRIGKTTHVSNGNIMARVRMTLLYHLASIKKGLVISTGNKSENELGFFTIHGDEPMDFPLLSRLYKSDVYDILRWYRDQNLLTLTPEQSLSINKALKILPTDGNGISSDLHQILGEEYTESLKPKAEELGIGLGELGYRKIDQILQGEDVGDIPSEIIDRVINRVKGAEFKQKFVNFTLDDF